MPVKLELQSAVFITGAKVPTEILRLPTRRLLNWPISIFMIIMHIGAIAALFMFSWKDLAVAVFLYWMATGLGISMGYHRLHTHRSYRVPRSLEYFFAVCGALTLEGGPIFWVATHRIHHQKSDQRGDPHSPRDGAWWAHIGWILLGESEAQQHPRDVEVRAGSGEAQVSTSG